MIRKIILIILLIVGFFIFVKFDVSATTTLSIDNDINEGAGYDWASISEGDYWVAQSFQAEHSNVDKISVTVDTSFISDYYDHEVIMVLCKGDHTEITSPTCEGGVYMGYTSRQEDWVYMYHPSNPHTLYDFEFDNDFYTQIGDMYTFTLVSNYSTTTGIRIEHDSGANSYANGRAFCQGAGCNCDSVDDLQFQVYYENDPEPNEEDFLDLDYDTYVPVDLDLCNSLPCFTFPRYQYCYSDASSTCDVHIFYNSYAYGVIYGFYEEDDFNMASSVASTTLGQYLGHTIITLPNEEVGSQEYDFLLANYNGYTIEKGTLWIEWISTSTLDNSAFYSLSEQICNCNSVSTSTGSLGDDFRYGLQCGARLIACHLLIPSENSTEKWIKANNNWKGQFPINIAYDFVHTVDLASKGGATTSPLAPLKWYNRETGQYEYQGVDLLATNTAIVGMGDELYNIYFTWFNRILWLLGVLYIVTRILKHFNPSFPSLSTYYNKGRIKPLSQNELNKKQLSNEYPYKDTPITRKNNRIK